MKPEDIKTIYDAVAAIRKRDIQINWIGDTRVTVQPTLASDHDLVRAIMNLGYKQALADVQGIIHKAVTGS